MKSLRLFCGVLMVCLIALQTSSLTIVRAQTPTPDPATVYIDDRSTPEALIRSLYSAINLHEYVRAYSYWEANATHLAAYPEFEQGYANTTFASVVIGPIRGGAAAGNVYFDVPVALNAVMNNNTQQKYIGCYRLHLGQPGNQGVPPFVPMGIQSADVRQVTLNTDTIAMLPSACPSDTGSVMPTATPAVDPLAIDASLYLDDRSSAVQVLRSMFNAVNRHEYVRAYSYWKPNSSQLLPFETFQQGYANTQSVVINTGTVQQDFGAGQLRYRVPVILIAQTTGGQTQSFVGCYQLHLSQPSFQGEPPFQPLGIESAQVNQAANNADLTGMLQSACGQG